MSNHLDYVLRLFDKGIICLPLRVGGKHLDLTAMGYDPVHRRTLRKEMKELAFTGIAFHLSQRPPSRDMMVSWFEKFYGNVGILAGLANLLILDFDGVRNFRLWSRNHERLLRSTPVARSPAGFHVYLRSAVPLMTSSLHIGLRRVGHAKALGGYIVASPSVLNDRSGYEWLPQQSLFDFDPAPVEDLASLSLLAVSPIKQIYDRLLGRGYFEDQ